MKNDKGFTLVEMMVVIAIMAIVSAIAIPNIHSYAAGMKHRSGNRELLTTLQDTRMKAIRQNTRWAVRFNGPSNRVVSYQIVDCGIDNTCGNTDDDNNGSQTKIATPIPPEVIVSHNFAGNLLIYSSDGTSNTGGAITAKKTKTPFVCAEDQVCAAVSVGGGMRLVHGGEIRNGVNQCPCS